MSTTDAEREALPPLPKPKPAGLAWQAYTTEETRAYGRECFQAGRAQALAEVAAAVLAERESCARLVEDQCGAWDEQGQVLVRMIRARPQPTAPEGGEKAS